MLNLRSTMFGVALTSIMLTSSAFASVSDHSTDATGSNIVTMKGTDQSLKNGRPGPRPPPKMQLCPPGPRPPPK